MAPEKLAIENEENNNNDSQKKKVPYDSKREIYSVGALLWEIAELKKPHYDLDKSVLFVGIRKRVSERYCLPFSNDVPTEWRTIVTFNIIYKVTNKFQMVITQHHVDVIDDDEVYNNPNLHSKEQDELEIPDDGI
ncbi:hypothetical protein GLOIN_2v1769255 [Rhizophagus irregularis DAOM 181602=DAOM 197198]|uniref:Protein kinase domain-containing protein n=1 Tax=Rhizophagus irregularis (strain DAOM 181602 / DAOM 197198 / MUCL 43194) TaxID=747089 RepID=A0A2P4QF09_RHIID|nr:hypothetical protein GLOIN_2v1769255 [Rhizophagus irregularis DAOM 181602=DAOM 197198]POG76235.1 hypothetical protein GLOIN_2v1769255 [Rhizophagus irregularis DAOM 181602=DAOM 197198]|eukprot:XP_025183101.1 hypothetical protein GLOIN_2v1769255 [Rhizophagus irregularis DAOM 181602=DAOM 197198]